MFLSESKKKEQKTKVIKKKSVFYTGHSIKWKVQFYLNMIKFPEFTDKDKFFKPSLKKLKIYAKLNECSNYHIFKNNFPDDFLKS